jgi:hypothetical protein
MHHKAEPPAKRTPDLVRRPHMSQAINKAKGHRFARLGVVLTVVLAMSGFGMALSASAAPVTTQCNGVFSGATPRDPIIKTADVSEAYPGGSVTYTIEWTSTGVATADVTDCFRIDDGSDVDINALVEALNYTDERANVGGADQAQSWSVTVEIPNDASLIGHSVVNRAKITHGSVESRSALVEVAIIEAPCTEDCNTDDGTTDDGTTDDGTTDDGTTDDGTTDDGTTDDGTTDDGTTDDGTTDDGSADDGTEVQGETIVKPKPKPQVAGEQLAQTGPETTMLTIIGLTFLMLGVALRFAQVGGRQVVTATGPDMLVARTLALVERTVTRNARWDCRH